MRKPKSTVKKQKLLAKYVVAPAYALFILQAFSSTVRADYFIYTASGGGAWTGLTDGNGGTVDPFYRGVDIPLFDSQFGALTQVSQSAYVSGAGFWEPDTPYVPGATCNVAGLTAEVSGSIGNFPLVVVADDTQYPSVDSGILFFGPVGDGFSKTGTDVNVFYAAGGTSTEHFDIFGYALLNGNDVHLNGGAGGTVIVEYDFDKSTGFGGGVGSTSSSALGVYGLHRPTLNIDTGWSNFGTLTIGSATSQADLGVVNLLPGGVLSPTAVIVNRYGEYHQSGGTLTTSSYFTNNGTSTISAGIASLNTLTNGTTGTFAQSGGSLTVTNAYTNNGTASHTGSGTIATFGSVTGTGTMTLGGGVTVTTGAFQQDALIIDGTASLTSTGAGRGSTAVVLDIGSLTLTSGAKLDIANHDLIIRGGQSLTQVKDLIKAAFGTGTYWSGTTGITSSAVSGTELMLGFATAGSVSLTMFDGVSVSSTDILVKYTYGGDANLDGKVDVTDNGIMASNYGTSTGMTWATGDFNYDGAVNISDLGILSTTYGRGIPPSPYTALDIAAFPSLPASVPEPTTLILTVLGSCFLLKRRYRHKSL